MNKKFKLFFSSLSIREKIAFRLHLFYSIIEGFILGVLALNEFVFIKSIGGTSYQLAFLFQFALIVFLIAPFIQKLLLNTKIIRKTIIISSFISRLPMILFIFFPDVSNINKATTYLFLLIFFLYYAANPIIYPNINFFLKNSYQNKNFGFLYSLSTSINKIVMLVVTFLYGYLLDFNANYYKIVLSITGVLSIVSSFILVAIPFKHSFDEDLYQNQTFLNFFSVLKKNKPFLMFQIAFMFYGFSFMIGAPVTNLFYKDVLNLNYSSVAFYRNVYNIIAIIVLPFMGRLLDKQGPIKFGEITFASLLLYFLFVALTGLFQYNFTVWELKIFYVMIIALIFHGLFASTMSLLWNIGSAYFGEKKYSAIYQNVHLFLTGVRAIPGPIIGVWIYETWNYVACFALAIILLVFGIMTLRFIDKTKKEEF